MEVYSVMDVVNDVIFIDELVQFEVSPVLIYIQPLHSTGNMGGWDVKRFG